MNMVEWMEDKLMEPLGKIAQNKYSQSIRDAFVIFALPVIITGAIFLIIANPPSSLDWGIINAWEDAITPIQGQILFPYNLTNGIMALTVAFDVGYNLASRHDIDAAMAADFTIL